LIGVPKLYFFTFMRLLSAVHIILSLKVAGLLSAVVVCNADDNRTPFPEVQLVSRHFLLLISEAAAAPLTFHANIRVKEKRDHFWCLQAK
jgi:hypothetical protein